MAKVGYHANPHFAHDDRAHVGITRKDSVYKEVDEFPQERLVDIRSPDDANTAVGDPALYGAQYQSGSSIAQNLHDWRHQNRDYIERNVDLPNWPFIVAAIGGALFLREVYGR